jgi:hypothetical protein
LIEAAREHQSYVAGETLATQLQLGDNNPSAMDYREQTQIEGLPFEIGLNRAAHT